MSATADELLTAAADAMEQMVKMLRLQADRLVALGDPVDMVFSSGFLSAVATWDASIAAMRSTVAARKPGERRSEAMVGAMTRNIGVVPFSPLNEEEIAFLIDWRDASHGRPRLILDEICTKLKRAGYVPRDRF